MTARQTSAAAFHSLDLTESESRVMKFMHGRADKFGCAPDSGIRSSLNRRQISVLSGIPINAVAGRINALVEKGYLEELPAERDPITGKSSHPIRVTAQQLELI